MSLKTRVAKLERAEPRSEDHAQRIMRIQEEIAKEIKNRSPEEEQKHREYKADLRVKQKERRKELRYGKR